MEYINNPKYNSLSHHENFVILLKNLEVYSILRTDEDPIYKTIDPIIESEIGKIIDCLDEADKEGDIEPDYFINFFAIRQYELIAARKINDLLRIINSQINLELLNCKKECLKVSIINSQSLDV